MMEIYPLEQYNKYLYGCRFCPMCKPASDVANVTYLESHTTRARAMMLWRIINKISDFSERDLELLYQSTLDSVSRSWCIHHYPVSEYILAARYEVLKRELVPDPVKNIINQKSIPIESININSDTLLISSELAESGSNRASRIVIKILKKCLGEVDELKIDTGLLYFSLGAFDIARSLAKKILEILTGQPVKTVIADGPYTLWILKEVFPSLGSSLPEDIEITCLDEVIYNGLKHGKLKIENKQSGKGNDKKRVFFHDTGVASFLAEGLSEQNAILPEFNGPEELLGKGPVYDIPREILRIAGYENVLSVWSRALSKSCGIEGGLWKTYPGIAEKLARRCIEEAKTSGAEAIFTDSILCYQQLKKSNKTEIEIKWLPEIFSDHGKVQCA